jgi:hypothetical protein
MSCGASLDQYTVIRERDAREKQKTAYISSSKYFTVDQFIRLLDSFKILRVEGQNSRREQETRRNSMLQRWRELLDLFVSIRPKTDTIGLVSKYSNLLNEFANRINRQAQG